MNCEGYNDPTAEIAVRHADRPPEHVMQIINMMRSIASIAGFDIVGRQGRSTDNADQTASDRLSERTGRA